MRSHVTKCPKRTFIITIPLMKCNKARILMFSHIVKSLFEHLLTYTLLSMLSSACLSRASLNSALPPRPQCTRRWPAESSKCWWTHVFWGTYDVITVILLAMSSYYSLHDILMSDEVLYCTILRVVPSFCFSSVTLSFWAMDSAESSREIQFWCEWAW